MKKGKGKRKVVFEIGNSKFDAAKLENITYKRLKDYGINYSDDIEMYVNLNEGKIYCVANGQTLVLDL